MAPNPALQPTPVGRALVRRVPALGGILLRAARLNAKSLGGQDATMRRRQTPPEKKRLDYEEQIRPLLEAPHAFRKNWAKKEARVNRRTRHQAAAIVRESIKRNDVEDLTAEAVKRVRKGSDIKKHYVMSLGERVKVNQADPDGRPQLVVATRRARRR